MHLRLLTMRLMNAQTGEVSHYLKNLDKNVFFRRKGDPGNTCNFK